MPAPLVLIAAAATVGTVSAVRLARRRAEARVRAARARYAAQRTEPVLDLVLDPATGIYGPQGADRLADPAEAG